MQNQPVPETDQSAADSAHAGTPHYGTFSDPANVLSTPERHPERSYVGGYLDPDGTHGGSATGSYDPTQQRGHADQNQATEVVRAAHGKDEDVNRASFAEDDSRYAGGNKFNLEDAQTGF